jgi:hypothetical protein
MTQGVKALRKIQMGRETTAGTAVAATSLWRGIGTIEDTRAVKHSKEDVGLAVPTDRIYVPLLGGKLSMDSVEATFEQLVHLLEGGIKAVGTGAADGTGSGKIYDYTLPTTALNAIKTYTFEGGDNNEVEEMEYAFVTDFSLSGRGNEAWMMQGNWQGRQVSLSSWTPAISIPTVEEILFSKTVFAVDDVSGDYGTTPKSNTLIEAKLAVKTGWVATVAMDGNLYFRSAQFSKDIFGIMLDLTLEFEATAAAERQNWKDKVPRLIQLKAEGSDLTTPGTTYSYKTLIINLAGTWDKFSKIGERDGNDIVTASFVAEYNATKAGIGNIIVVNELASVP